MDQPVITLDPSEHQSYKWIELSELSSDTFHYESNFIAASRPWNFSMIKVLLLFFILINAAHSGVVVELREHTKEEKKQVKKVTYFDDSAEVTSSSSIFVIKKGAKLRKDLNYIILDKQIKAKVRYFPNKRYAKIINEKARHFMKSQSVTLFQSISP